jgi:hypothetical protein
MELHQTVAAGLHEKGLPEDPPWRSWWSKATFLGSCWASLLILLCLEGAVFYLVEPRLARIDHLLLLAVGAAMVSFFFVPFVGLSLITATALTGIDLLCPRAVTSITIAVLFSIAPTLAQLLGIERNRLRTSFVKVNNALTRAQWRRIRGDRVVVLLPHCLQIDVCNRKLTTDVNNCLRCGKCPVGRLLELGDKYGLHLEVVNGGTLARRRVAAFRPSGIIAVACERDLTFGIQDVHPVPVYGVINDRPNGPCVNTCVDMDMVEEAIKFFKRPS